MLWTYWVFTSYFVILITFCMSLFGRFQFWVPTRFPEVICPRYSPAKINLGLEIQKTNVGIRISIFEISCVPISRQNRQLWLFWPKFTQKLILGSEVQKSKCRFKIRPCVPIFSQNGQLWNFWPKFGEIAQLRATF